MLGILVEEVGSRHLSGHFDRGDCKDKQDSSWPLMTWNSFKQSSKQHISKRKPKPSRCQTESASLQTRGRVWHKVRHQGTRRKITSALFNSFSQEKTPQNIKQDERQTAVLCPWEVVTTFSINPPLISLPATNWKHSRCNSPSEYDKNIT